MRIAVGSDFVVTQKALGQHTFRFEATNRFHSVLRVATAFASKSGDIRRSVTSHREPFQRPQSRADYGESLGPSLAYRFHASVVTFQTPVWISVARALSKSAPYFEFLTRSSDWAVPVFGT